MRKFIMKWCLPILALFAAPGLSAPQAALAAGDLLTSTFPIYLFTKNITQGSDTYEVKLMIDSTIGCPHDYAPTPGDLERLSQADVLVMNGLGLEEFLPRALRVAKDSLKIVDASGGQAGSLATAASTGLVVDRRTVMARPHLIDGPNPHLFAAPSTASAMARNIGEGLAVLDPDKAALYRTNAARLAGELEELANTLRLAGQTLGHPQVIVSHGAFDFLAQDMRLDIVASIEEADGAEPSAARLAELAKLARDRGVWAIMVDPDGDVKTARTLGAEAKVPVVVIDPVASGPADAPLDYYQKVMLTNAQVLLDLFTKPQPTAPAKGSKK